jgi:hypothetical protein
MGKMVIAGAGAGAAQKGLTPQHLLPVPVYIKSCIEKVLRLCNTVTKYKHIKFPFLPNEDK